MVRKLTRPLSRLFGDLLFRRLYHWQVGRFFADPKVGEEFLPLLYQQFAASPTAHEAFFGLNRDLPATVASRTAKLARLRRFARAVRILFGAADPYRSPRVARLLHALLPTSQLFLLPDARHYVQLDQPTEVARLLLAIPER
jgi:haloalkane dehalogenase